MRADLVANTRHLLAKAGFLVSPPVRERPASFDLIARRDDELYIIKVLQNVDALSGDVAREMRLVANLLGGRPVLFGLRTSSGDLEPGVVYVRHDVPLLAFQTVEEWLLEGIPLLAYAAPGGFYVRLDGDTLRAVREERGLSLGQLATVAGVSRRAIRMYESGMSTVVEVAARLEQYLDVPLALPLDPFDLPARVADPVPQEIDKVADARQRDVLIQLSELGLEVTPTTRSPFQALSTDARREASTIITGVVADETLAIARSSTFDAISQISERRSLFVVATRRHKGKIGSTPVLTLKELLAVADPAELLEQMDSRADE